jgi:filamentous hemagglutinin
MAGNATAQVLATGRLDAGNVLRSGLSGAISGALSGYYGNSYGLSRLAAEAAGGCAGAAMNGGQCGEGAKSAFVTASLAWAGAEMRQAMIEDSKKFAGICDAQGNCLDNKSGTSVGVNEDRFKLAGGRVDIEKICGEANCKINPDGSFALDELGRIQLRDASAVDGAPLNLYDLLAAHPDWRSPMGGWQGALGRFAFFDYTPGSAWDRIAEAYAGPHDMFNSLVWYDDIGNVKAWIDGGMLGHIGNVTNYTNVLLATPFALGTLIPGGSLDAIRIGAEGKGTQR